MTISSLFSMIERIAILPQDGLVMSGKYGLHMEALKIPSCEVVYSCVFSWKQCLLKVMQTYKSFVAFLGICCPMSSGEGHYWLHASMGSLLHEEMWFISRFLSRSLG